MTFRALAKQIRKALQSRRVRAFRKAVPLAGFVDDHTLLTKQGGAVVCFRHAGLDDECLMDEVRERASAQLCVAQRQLEGAERLYQYAIRREGQPLVHQAVYENPKVQEVQDDRHRHLEENARFGSINLYSAVLRQGEYRKKKSTAAMLAERKKVCSTLLSKAESYADETADPFGTEVLRKQDAFLFLRKLLNLDPSVADSLPLQRDSEVDWQLVGQPLKWDEQGNHLRQGNRHIRVLSIKEAGFKSESGLPNQTKPNLLKETLAVDCNLIVCQQWRPAEHPTVRQEVKDQKKHINDFERHGALDPELADEKADELLADESAEERMKRLGAVLQQIENEGDRYGLFSYTVILHGEDNAKLDAAIAQLHRIWGECGGALFEEDRGALAAYLAILPGNDRYNVREQWISNRHFADLSLCYAPDTGSLTTSELADGTEYLAAFETRDAVPFYWNPFVGGAFGLFGIGRRGRGKTFLANFLVTSAQKFNGRTVILDLGQNYRQTVQQFGGIIVSLHLQEQTFQINPFALDNTPDNRQFLFEFLRFLIEADGGDLNHEHEQMLFEQIGSMWTYDPEDRTLSTFYLHAPAAYKHQLRKWVRGGQFGWVFDNGEDTVSLARLTCFEFAGVDDYPDLVEPLVLWILGRTRAEFFDAGRVHEFKLINADEIWRFLKSPRILDWLTQMLKFGRNRLVACALWTQSAEDLSAATRLVVDNCETVAFLGNPHLDRAFYRDTFQFNERELELAASLQRGKHEFLLKTLDYSKVLRLTVDRKAYWRWTTRPKEQRIRQEALAQYGEHAMEMLAASGGKN